MSRIYRGAYGSPAVEVEFDTSPVSDSAGYVHSTGWRIRHLASGIDSPDPASAGTIQDTGKTVEVTVAGQLRASGGTARAALRRIALSDYVSTAYPFGDVGLEIDRYPEMDVSPSAVRGLVVLDAQFMLPEDQPSKIGFVMGLRLMGGRGASPGFGWGF